jgi:hypothetical protein
MQCGLCGGDVHVGALYEDIDERYFACLFSFTCSGCGACQTLDDLDADEQYYPPHPSVRPVWIAAPLSTMIVRCLCVYGRDGRRVRTPGAKTCVAWER